MEEKKKDRIAREAEETSGTVDSNRLESTLKTPEDGEGKAENTEKTEAGDSAGRKKPRLLPVWILLVLCAVCAGGYYYYYNLPAQKFARAMEAADTLLEEGQYEEAAGKYTEAVEIDSGSAAAQEGLLRALTGQADLLAEQEGISERSRGCGLYRQILELCETLTGTQTAESEYVRLLPGETQKKLELLCAEIAAEYTSVETEMETDDRSETVTCADGSEKTYSWYYDLVRVSDPEYPYAEEINTVLEQERDAFFERTKEFPAAAASSVAKDGDFRDYIGLAGIYTGEGLLCIRSAEIRTQGTTRVNEYTGTTFRLSDARELTLVDLVEKTESGLRRLIERRLREWFDLEGYRNIPRSALEDYVQDTPPEEFKFCFRDDGKLCLVIDQTIPFFAAGTEILEIPLEE